MNEIEKLLIKFNFNIAQNKGFEYWIESLMYIKDKGIFKVGDWIRTKAGQIHKVTKITPFYFCDELLYERQGIYWDNKNSGYEIWQLEDIIVKHSPNLIDIIKERRLCKWKKNRNNCRSKR